MALIKCPECGGQVSDTARNCVHCGFDVSEYVRLQKLAKFKAEKAELIRRIMAPNRVIVSIHCDRYIKEEQFSFSIIEQGFFGEKSRPIQLITPSGNIIQDDDNVSHHTFYYFETTQPVKLSVSIKNGYDNYPSKLQAKPGHVYYVFVNTRQVYLREDS